MPIPPALIAAAPAIAQAAGGLFQTLFSGRKKAQKEMEGVLGKSPAYTPNRGISDYYQESLSRYKENPMQSALYQNQMRNAQRVTAQGLGALQDRRSALAGVGRLAAIQNDASQNALVQAERMRDARFGQLGQATQAKAGEERRAFDINQLTPYQQRLQMAQMKASAANARFDAGLTNLFGGAANLGLAMSAKPSSTQGQTAATASATTPASAINFAAYNPKSTPRFSNKSVLPKSFGNPLSLMNVGQEEAQQGSPSWNKFNQAFTPKRQMF